MTRPERVILFGIDGLRPDMVTEASMPNLTALRCRGVWCRNHRTVFPSETRGALTALATGTQPAVNGVLGNQFHARGGQMAQTFTHTVQHWRTADAMLPGGMVNAPGLAEFLAREGRSLAVVTSSGQGSLAALNWKGAIHGQTGFNVRHPQISFPAGTAAAIRERHGIPLDGCTEGTEGKAVETFIGSIWPDVRPDVSIIWLTEVDSAAHVHGLGAEEHLTAMRRCDQALGRLVAWRDALPESEEISLMVTSDHGHVTISDHVSVRSVLVAAGFNADDTFEGGADILVGAGRAAGLWFRKPELSLMQDVFDCLGEQPWFGGGFSAPADPTSHLGQVEGTLSLNLIGVGHRRAPDLYINLAGNSGSNRNGIAGGAWCDVSNYNIAVGGGTHGGLHRLELASVFLAEGPRFATGATSLLPTGICDLAPTILHLLGCELPRSASGRPLTEIMRGGAPSEEPCLHEYIASRGGSATYLTVSRFLAATYLGEAWSAVERSRETARTDEAA